MAQKQYIKYLYEVEDKSLREISRITGHSFETVKKYAYQTNWSEDNLPDTRPSRHPVLGSFIPAIDGWLEADKKIPKKQRHTAWRIYCRLCDEYDFKGSYSSVKKYVRKKKYVMKKTGPGYIPLESVKGSGQVDFGKSTYIDADGFSRFMLHYRFQAEFCNPSAGNEKGNVENKVGYSRRNAFVPVPEITSFDEFNEKLFAWCEEDGERKHYIHDVTINELWKEDR